MSKLIKSFKLLVLSMLSFSSFSQGDECNQALFLNDVNNYCSNAAQYSNATATVGAFPVATCWGANQSRDVWFSFVASAPDVLVSALGMTNGTIGNPRIAIYSGDCAGTINELACTNTFSNSSAELYQGGLTIGETYLIRVSSSAANAGTFKLCVNNYTQPNNPGADCGGAAYLCDKSTFSVANLSGGGTNADEAEASACMENPSGSDEQNSAWFYWKCSTSGTLTFDLKPAIATTDLDWIIYELNTSNICGTRTLLRCNATSCLGNTGWTGINSTDTDLNEQPGCSSPSTTNGYCSQVNMVAGKYYALLINNADNNSGFSLSFGGTGEFEGPKPVLSASALSVCAGDDIIYNASTSTNVTGGLAWTISTDSGNQNFSGAGPHTVNYPTVGNYVAVLVGTDGTGCQDTKSVNITVTNCGCTVAANNSGSVCQGGTFNLTASAVAGATSYTWTGPSGYTSNVQNPTNVPAISGTYTVTVVSPTGTCSASTNFTMYPLPTVDAGSPLSVCQGQSVTLNGSGANTYSWTNSVSNNVSFIPSATATYTVTGTGVNNCTNTDQVVVTVNALPTITANAAPASICQGQSTVLTGNGGTTYTWNNGLGTGNNLNASPNATITYTVSGTDANGCVNTGQVTVTVNPNVPVNAGPDQAVCVGQQVTLTASGTPTYSWSNGVTNGTAFTPASTTTYTVTGTSANGCVTTDQITVTVNALPTVDAGSPVSVCPGQSVTLNGSGATSYSWSNGINNGVAFTPAGTGTYTVTGTDANNCTNIDQVVVTVNTLPTITASAAPASICQGQSTVLSGTGGTSYSWDNGVGAGNNLNASPSATTTYNVSGTDANGCVNIAQVTVTVNPNTPVNAGADQAVCAGQQVTLTASGTPTYSWSNGVTNGTAFTPASTTTYTVTGTSANGCVTTDQVTVTVNALPNINAGADQMVCVGQSVTLSGSNGQTYTWDNGVTNGTAFTVGTTTTYTVTGTDANGCIGTDQVTVTALPVPVADVSSDITSGEAPLTVTFYNNSFNATSYTWDFGTGLPVNATNTNDQVLTYGNPGTYNVVLIADNGACIDTAMLLITVFPAPAPELTPPNVFTPNKDGSNDFYFIPFKNLVSIEVYIQNRWGNTIYEYNTLNGYWDGKIEGKEADEGVYFYKYKAKGTNGEELTGHGFFHLER